jgi:hypothetical protein
MHALIQANLLTSVGWYDPITQHNSNNNRSGRLYESYVLLIIILTRQRRTSHMYILLVQTIIAYALIEQEHHFRSNKDNWILAVLSPSLVALVPVSVAVACLPGSTKKQERN